MSIFKEYEEDIHDSTNHVRCEVTNCRYNHGDACGAEEITVGPSFAITRSDTVCSTFKPEN
jgi:hypothetical protein